jgi:ribosomal protein S18 acetylase RimI-like enzyme
MIVTVDMNPSEKDVEYIHDNLSAYNAGEGYTSEVIKFLVSCKDDSGMILGGAVCHIFWEWIFVSLLWVDESYRGRGWGSEIMYAVERQAREQNCIGVFLDTVDFQAPGFYEKLGYEVYGVLDDMPRGQKRYYFRKRMDEDTTKV